MSTYDSPPPSLLDKTTLTSLASTVALLLTAFLLSRRVLDPHTTPTRLRALFIWHAFDALIHFVLEGSFVYHCLFSSVPISQLTGEGGKWGRYLPDPGNYLNAGVGAEKVVHGAQAGGENPLAVLWMVYARADWRWAGVDLVRFPHHLIMWV
jgi:hypothetical protein